jgi:hypothetical protein
MHMPSDQLYSATAATTARGALITDKQHAILRLRLLGAYLLLTIYGAIFTCGQFYVYTHFDPPWRDALLIASVLLEYWGFARMSAWMYLHVDIPMLVEECAQRKLPVVLASSGAPDEKDVEEVLRTARTLGRPVLLVNLAMLMENEDWSWIYGVWTQLAEQGIQVSAESIMIQRPQDALKGILSATKPPYIITGQLKKLDPEGQGSAPTGSG